MLAHAIVRPRRAQYTLGDLGPRRFHFMGKEFCREDVTLTNKKGLSLQCSHWKPLDDTKGSRTTTTTTSTTTTEVVPAAAATALPCVIYLHENASSRASVVPLLSRLLSLGATVFAFDFAGSGMSGGDFVSLGYFESEDLGCVLQHLRDTGIRYFTTPSFL
jgi:hypothetical protein